MLQWIAGALLALTAPAEPAPVIAGGWSEVANPSHNAETCQAAKAAVAQLGRRHARLARIESASQQVVAGVNYRLVLRLKDKSRWQVTVWRQLSGTYELTDKQRLR